MKIYKFDKTIYQGYCGFDFYLFCLKDDKRILYYLPKQLISIIKYVIGFENQSQFYEGVYSFLQGVSNIDRLVERFWQVNHSKINSWYINQKLSTDLIFSNSPYFLLSNICEKMKVINIIGLNIDKETGEYNYQNDVIDKIKNEYSDKKKSAIYSNPILEKKYRGMAENSFIVFKGKIIPSDLYKISYIDKLKIAFISIEFTQFLIIGGINAFNCIVFASILSLIFNVNTSFVISYMISLIISYLLNSMLVFKESLTFIKLLRFCVSYVPNFVIQNSIIFVLYNILDFNHLFTYFLSTIVGIPCTYIMIRFFAFKKHIG